MFGGGFTVPGAQPAVVIDLEAQRQKTWDNLEYAAKAHAEAVARGLESKAPGTDLDKAQTDDILRKGTTLDSCILSARMHGFSVEAIAAVPGLHPAYAEELIRMSEGHSPF